MILYYDERSPPVRSVLMLLKILDLDVELRYVDLFKGDQNKDEYKALNPAHTVPVLVDDRLILTDSHVILIHLCERYQSDKMKFWPSDYMERMKVLNLLMFESSVVFRRDSDMMSEIVRKTFDNIDFAFHQRKILEMFDMLEAYLSKSKFMATDNLTIADLSIITTLSTVDLMFPFEEKPDKWPRLKKWLRFMQQLPEYQINERGLKALRAAVEKCGKFTFPKAK